MTGTNRCSRILTRLARDSAGNTLAIAAASLIPLMALIGGGVDISRAYMAKTQLQSACDAGVLAGRKAMSRSGSYGNNEKAKASSMFNFNFDSAALDVRNVSYVTNDNDDGQVLGSATAVLPTLIMKIFDKDSVDLAVDCMAELQIGNADIMFVLDTTGSMGDPISSGEDDKIVGLRDAVRDFHKTINQAVSDNRTRIRYGFVPYSMAVNVRGLLSNGDMSTDYFREEARYRSRVATFDDPVYVGDTELLDTEYETYGSEIEESDCLRYGRNDYPYDGRNPVRSGQAPNPVTSTEYNYVDWNPTRRVGSGRNRRWIGQCTRRSRTTRTTYETRWKFTGWEYMDDDIPTTAFLSLDPVSIASSVNSDTTVATRGDYDVRELATMIGTDAWGVGTSSYTWNGCIEARSTVPEADFDPIPDDAYDLNLSVKPDAANPDTLWRPLLPGLAYVYQYNYGSRRYEWGNPSSACPAPMMLLTEVELSDSPDDVPEWLNSYVNNLNPEGNTYHDVGMIWGARMTNPNGIFAENVNKDADKINVSKHIIFMTDGIMQPTSSGYSAYGVENYQHRIAPSGSEDTITARHTARFNAMCEQIKAQGTTIWVIAFGTSMTGSLRDCASDGRSYYSSNTEQLRSTFKYIAAQVADLRLGA